MSHTVLKEISSGVRLGLCACAHGAHHYRVAVSGTKLQAMCGMIPVSQEMRGDVMYCNHRSACQRWLRYVVVISLLLHLSDPADKVNTRYPYVSVWAYRSGPNSWRKTNCLEAIAITNYFLTPLAMPHS